MQRPTLTCLDITPTITHAKEFLLVALCLLTTLASPTSRANEDESEALESFSPHVWALELAVPDPEAAARAYVRALGFTIEREAPSGAWAIVKHNRARIVLRRSTRSVAPAGTARMYLNLRVGSLPSALESVREAGFGVPSPTPKDNAIGQTIRVLDPGGNPLNLINVEGDDMRHDDMPAVFNIGLRVLDMPAAEQFFTTLNFGIFSRDYLPETLVLERHGAIPLVLHPAVILSTEASAPEADTGRLVFAIDDIEASEAMLRQLGFAPRRIKRGHWSGQPALSLPAPAGRIDLVQVRSDSAQETASHD